MTCGRFGFSLVSELREFARVLLAFPGVHAKELIEKAWTGRPPGKRILMFSAQLLIMGSRALASVS